MKPEVWNIIEALWRISTLFAAAWLGYKAHKDGWFNRYKWACPHEGCDYRHSTNQEWANRRLKTDHIVSTHRGWMPNP